MRRAEFALLIPLLLVASALRAQATLPVDSRVRVSLRNGSTVTGRLAAIRGDTLVVVEDGLVLHLTARIPADRMTRIEMSRGEYTHPGRVFGGAVLGAVGSLVLIYAVPGLVDDGCSGDVCSGPSFEVPLFIGAIAGAILGGLDKADRWESVPVPIRLGFDSGLQRAHVGVAIAF